MLNNVEKDFIEFMAGYRNRPHDEIEKIFVQTKKRLAFAGERYNKFGGDLHQLFHILYDTSTEIDAIRAYKAHELLHLFTFISYTYPKTIGMYANDLIRDLKKWEWKNIRNFLKRKLMFGNKTKSKSIAQYLLEKTTDKPVIVDYGCGVGYISFEIASLNRSAKVYLIDIDCLTLDFALYRFTKYGFDVETIKVTPENPYPSLPSHSICIASEVMEHLLQPMVAYENIRSTIASGGLLYGNFEDHDKDLFHVSANLSRLRENIDKDFNPVGLLTYRKK